MRLLQFPFPLELPINDNCQRHFLFGNDIDETNHKFWQTLTIWISATVIKPRNVLKKSYIFQPRQCFQKSYSFSPMTMFFLKILQFFNPDNSERLDSRNTSTHCTRRALKGFFFHLSIKLSSFILILFLSIFYN